MNLEYSDLYQGGLPMTCNGITVLFADYSRKKKVLGWKSEGSFGRALDKAGLLANPLRI